jgi:hypothetical protein
VLVSEKAKTVLASFLEGRGEEHVLRMGAINGGHALALDEVRAGDLTFRHRGRPVLVVAAEVAQELWGLAIDCRKVGTGLGIVLRRMTSPECGDTGTASSYAPPMDSRNDEHRRLLREVGGITAQIAALRLSHSTDRVARIRELETTKHAKWHEIRTLWAGGHNARPNSRAVVAVPTIEP